MSTARHRESFWLTDDDKAALAVMASAESKNFSEKVRDLIREAWARWPANQPQMGAVPQSLMTEEERCTAVISP